MRETKRESEKFSEKHALLGFRHCSVENLVGLEGWKLFYMLK